MNAATQAWAALKQETDIDYALAHALQPTPIPTGIDALDRAMNGGLPVGLMTVVAGEAGCGKSALACSATYNAAIHGTFPVYFSIEMPTQMVVSRMLSIHTAKIRELQREHGVPDEAMMRQVWWSTTRNEIGRCAGRMPQTMAEAQAYVYEHAQDDHVLIAWEDFSRQVWPRMAVCDWIRTIDEVCERTEELCDAGLRPLVVVDYLQIGADGGDGSEYERITRASGRLMALAKRYQIAVLVISAMRNLSREERKERPTLSMLRGSGRIGFDAGAVVMLKRSSQQEEGSSLTNIEAHIVKNRNGKPDVEVPLQFNGGKNEFC